MKLLLAILLATSTALLPARAQMRGYHNTGRVAVGNRNANVNRNYNANVNRNVNVNVNRNVNVHGGYYGGGCCYYHDDWGSFAAGAAVGAATTAVVAAATRPRTTTVVTTAPAPAIGTIMGTLPGSCSAISAGGGVIYNCSNVYYRPFLSGNQSGLSGGHLSLTRTRWVA